MGLLLPQGAEALLSKAWMGHTLLALPGLRAPPSLYTLPLFSLCLLRVRATALFLYFEFLSFVLHLILFNV